MNVSTQNPRIFALSGWLTRQSESANFSRRLLLHFLIATGLIVALLPYVWATNTDATRLSIIVHSLLYWLFTPICIAIAESLVRRLAGLKNLLQRLLGVWLGLAFAALLMIIIFHLISGVAIAKLVVTNLFLALIPVYLSYSLIMALLITRSQSEKLIVAKHQASQNAWQALSSQMRPHFLFNALNCIEPLIDKDQGRARESLGKLAAIYRKILENSKKTLVPLEEELQLVSDYLTMQKLRFGERLKYRLPPEILQIEIPGTILLNLVENALKHGIEPSLKGGQVQVRTTIHGDYCELVVENTLSEQRSQVDSLGHGSSDLKKRLQLIYGDQASFNLEEESTRMIARLRLPRQRGKL